jgi:hypothetical protein
VLQDTAAAVPDQVVTLASEPGGRTRAVCILGSGDGGVRSRRGQVTECVAGLTCNKTVMPAAVSAIEVALAEGEEPGSGAQAVDLDPRTGCFQAPHPDTVCRVMAQVDAAEVDAVYARRRAAPASRRRRRSDRDDRGRQDSAGNRGRPGPRPAPDGRDARRGRHHARWTWTARATRSPRSSRYWIRFQNLTNVVISADMMHTQT